VADVDDPEGEISDKQSQRVHTPSSQLRARGCRTEQPASVADFHGRGKHTRLECPAFELLFSPSKLEMQLPNVLMTTANNSSG
jgi:hypothetical protein